MIDLLLLAVLGVVTWCVASEGAWGAGIVFFSVLFSGLLAMNFFEPLAQALEQAVPAWGYYWDVVSLLGLFTALVFGFRAAADYLMPTYIEVHAVMHNIVRWLFAAATGYLVVAILLTSLHTAPLPRSFLGFDPGPGRKQFFGLAPDTTWLGFTQYVTTYSLGGSGGGFDAATFERIPGKPDTRTTFSSFPIRYATRRSAYHTGVAAATTTAPGGGTAAPPPTVAPSGPRRVDF